MSRTCRILLCVLSAVACISAQICFCTPASARTLPVLSTRHKFTPPGKKVARTTRKAGTSSGIVLLTDGRSTIKKRPAGYFLQKIISQNLRRRLSARSAIVMDAATGEAIYAHAPDRPGQPASTIKVLTGIIAIDSLPKNELVPVSRHAARMPRSKVYLRKGKKYPANDLINAVLLASANDASVALAEKIGGSEKTFARLMTAKAAEFGAQKTICKTASGLTARGQQSTARDLAVIFNKAMENRQFAAKMSRTKVRTKEGKIIRSHNKALWQIEGTEGGKTGYTNVARQTYVGKFRRGDIELVVALMGSESMWNDVKKLVRYGFAKKEYQIQLAARQKKEQEQLSSMTKLVRLTDSLPADTDDTLVLLTSLKKRPSL